MDPVLEAKGISKRFPGVLALDGVSLALHPGEVHALVGENGAGKSTLIKVFTGVYAPDGGELSFQGRPAAFGTPLEAQRAGISTIYQEVNLVPMMSVARNLLLGREPRGRLGVIDAAVMNGEAERILAGYGVETDVRRPLRTLGVGAQQMVALARAVSVDARVVIMDEPTSSLEPREVATLFEVIRRLRAAGIAVMYVSHRLDELYQVCDRVTVLRDGRVAHTGPLAGLERLTLISLMLGRELDEVRSRGLTSFTRRRAGAGTPEPGTERAPEPRMERAAEPGTERVAEPGMERVNGQAPVVEARGLTRRHVLRGVDVTVRPGEVVGLGGLLGAGRTETAKAIVGALPLDGGRVLVAGLPLRGGSTAAAIRAGVSLLPEDRKAEGIVPTLSVRENIALAALPALARAGVVSEARIDRVVEIFMRRLRIKAASPHQLVSELSGGNQQKVLLARWLAVRPKALLLDEPTRGIDVGAKAEVQALIDELAAEGLGVLLISSDLEELVEGADRILVLRDGAVAGELSGDEVTEEKIMATIAEQPPEQEQPPERGRPGEPSRQGARPQVGERSHE
ncbi:sugar ABC transporter ATP-binding protein [Nonomuraea pusilla]|uniref:Ribose transport system ATP-binding protein n=1 Tax=Nonomuraea pusilla TaxID=46177 RepID=A0A1H7TGQ3_9ACTN|nr:sugar ABC transporter ATP-binding protein [Nonomuraea pusilla]SEL83516.1 ribose transport system ATP-binding protein [Nonomuraea pusilla]